MLRLQQHATQMDGGKDSNRESQNQGVRTIDKTLRKTKVNCWHCKTELIWGSDSNCEHLEEYDFVTFLSCPKCEADVEVYHPKPKSKTP